MARARSPSWRELRRTAAFPSGVLGPVDFNALRRFASICLRDAINFERAKPILGGDPRPGTVHHRWAAARTGVGLERRNVKRFVETELEELAGGANGCRDWVGLNCNAMAEATLSTKN